MTHQIVNNNKDRNYFKKRLMEILGLKNTMIKMKISLGKLNYRYEKITSKLKCRSVEIMQSLL